MRRFEPQCITEWWVWNAEDYAELADHLRKANDDAKLDLQGVHPFWRTADLP